MDYKNEPNRFVNTYFISALFCFVIVVFALLIYFILPSSTKENISASSEVISLEDEKDQISQESAIENPAEEGAPRAPETMIRILKLTETGFVGTVQNNGGFTVFEDGTEITVTVDLETDPNFKPEDYQIGDLVHVMYTDWDVNDRTMVASILGIVDKPIRD